MEALFGHTPDYDKLRTFGCKCYSCLHHHQRNKLDDKSISCVFIGCPQQNDGFSCYRPKENKIYVSKNVKFIEEYFTLNEHLWPNYGKKSQSEDSQTIETIFSDELEILDQSGLTEPVSEPLCHTTNPIPNLTDPTVTNQVNPTSNSTEQMFSSPIGQDPGNILIDPRFRHPNFST